MSSPWEISPEEHAANRVQFITAGPQNGKLTAMAARGVLVKSGLAQQILAQIWALSDLDRDGQLDEREFSIAMKLTRNAMAGMAMPPQLPPSMLQMPQMSMPQMVPPLPAMPQYNTAPPAVMQNALRTGFSAGTWSTGRQLGDWSIPHQKKLHHAQQFNQLDKQRVGWLAGNVARNAMGLSGLPMPTLAHIWNLSDVNKDGRLNVDEFCIASFLIEMHKDGYALPVTTPPELAQLCGGDRSQADSPHLEPGAPPPQKTSTPKTFEDKRKDNFDKGQAELDRRRQILQEEEDRRKAEIQKREREEFEKKERERLEKERRAEEERRAEAERQRILYEQRMEEERKREEEREAIRKEQEKARMVELEKTRLKEMQTVKEKEAEHTAQRLQRQKTLGFQLQALDEKAVDVESEIGQARGRIELITKEIEGMRESRDTKVARIQQLQTKHQQAAVRSQELAHALLQLQTANRDTTAQLDEIERTQKKASETRALLEKLRGEVEEAKARTAAQNGILAQKQEAYAIQKPKFEAFNVDYKEGLRLLQQLQAEARQMVEKKRQEQQQRQASIQSPQTRDAFAAQANPFSAQENGQKESHSHGSSTTLPSNTTSAGTVKYRAKFDFEGRSEDELSFQQGEIVLVFEGHASEPGWLAGQIRNKVGWFPEAFAEPLAPVNTNITQPIQSVSEVVASPSLERIQEEDGAHETIASLMQKTRIADEQAQAQQQQPASTPEAIIGVATAQFAWKARNEGDLSFAKGDVIQVIEQQEMKWRGRKTDGTVGWFPKSYAKMTAEKTAPQSNGHTQQAPAYDVPPGDIPATTSQQSLNKQTSLQSSHSVTSPPPMYDAPPGDYVAPAYDTPPGDVPSSTSQHSLAEAAWKTPAGGTGAQPNGEWFVAVFNFEAVEEGDLPLTTGDRILVLEQKDQWWKGVSNGREGVFPANYVEKGSGAVTPGKCSERARVIVDFTASSPGQLALRKGDTVTVTEKSRQGWWHGEVVRDGHSTQGWFPGDYVESMTNGVTSPSGTLAIAQFDYEATQHDELSLKVGDRVIVTHRQDADWWTGHLQNVPTHSGVFPSAYVQIEAGSPVDDLSSVVSAGTSTPHHPVSSKASIKMQQLVKEFASSEERYLADIELAMEGFVRPLNGVIPADDVASFRMNWDELRALSRNICRRLHQGSGPGEALLSELDGLQAFPAFCFKQQSAIADIERVLRDPNVQRIYAECCSNPATRGMSLHTLFLVPLGRITRYPLLLEKMIEECVPEEASSLEAAHQVTVNLLDSINRNLAESETMCLLAWCQSHVRVPVQPPLEFASPTRQLGSRKLLHSGILWKARSGRQLVAILFNDFLLLTTPSETVANTSGFRLSPQSELTLTTYRSPLLLHKLMINDRETETEGQITLKHGDHDVISLRATSGNASRLWLSHLRPAINEAISREGLRTPANKKEVLGRLLVELVSLSIVNVKTSMPVQQVGLRVSLHDNSKTFAVDLNKKGELVDSCQFLFTEKTGMIRLLLVEPRVFCPDVPLIEETALPFQNLFNQGPGGAFAVRKEIDLLANSSASNTKQRAVATVRFALHMYKPDFY